MASVGAAQEDQKLIADESAATVGEDGRTAAEACTVLPGNSRLHLISACEESLRRLKTDYIDLYQIHRPSFDIPVDETLGALTDLVCQGKVRYIGSSTAPAWKLMESLMVSEAKGYARFVSEQPPYNLLDRRIENELVPLCRTYGLGILPWSPLAMGLLAGRYPEDSVCPADSRATLRGGYMRSASPLVPFWSGTSSCDWHNRSGCRHPTWR